MRRTRSLRVFVTGLLVLFALITAVATATHNVPPDGGVVITLSLSLVALLSAELDRWFGRTEAAARDRDVAENARAQVMADRARSDVLGQVRRAWVRPALTSVLEQKAAIRIRLVERPQAVAYPVGELGQARYEGAGDPGSIGDAFEDMGRQLLILGEPGAGKTTLLMRLTEQLLIEAEQLQAKPIPVVFHLASWSVEEHTLTLWLVDELHKRYGVPRRLSQAWVGEDQLVPLLDGLDEVPDRDRNACVQAINSFHDEHGLQPLVVTSRVAEYDELASKLKLRGAVEIEPLTSADVNSYLDAAGPEVSGLRALVQEDRQLQALLTAPLFLNMAAQTYTKVQPAAASTAGSISERRAALVADFVGTMLSRSFARTSATYSRDETVGWLRWLAKAMRTHGETVFYLDWIQPGWLPKPNQHGLPAAAASLVAGALAAAIIVVLATVLTVDASPAVRAVALIVGTVPIAVLVGLLSYKSSIEPSDALHWSRTAIRDNPSKWTGPGTVAFGLLLGILGGTLFGLLASSRFASGKALLFGVLAGVIFALPAGLIFGLVVILISGLQPSSYVARPGPGIAIVRSRRNGLVSGAVAALVAAVILGTAIWLVIWIVSGLLVGLDRGTLFAPTDLVVSGTLGAVNFRFAVGLVAGIGIGLPVALLIGIVVGFQRGVGAYVRHVCTRWLLIINGVIPRDYLGFLEYVRRLGVIRTRGGGYEFIHALVLEHFAVTDGIGAVIATADPVPVQTQPSERRTETVS